MEEKEKKKLTFESFTERLHQFQKFYEANGNVSFRHWLYIIANESVKLHPNTIERLEGGMGYYRLSQYEGIARVHRHTDALVEDLKEKIHTQNNSFFENVKSDTQMQLLKELNHNLDYMLSSARDEDEEARYSSRIEGDYFKICSLLDAKSNLLKDDARQLGLDYAIFVLVECMSEKMDQLKNDRSNAELTSPCCDGVGAK